MVLEVHGSDIQPFGYEDRVDFLVALDDAIVHINLSNIELLAVEEFLPAAGPAAESLLNLYGANGVIGKPTPKPQAEAEAPSGNVATQTLSGNPVAHPQTRAAGRKLLQIPARGSFNGACNPRPCPPSSVCMRTKLLRLYLHANARHRTCLRCVLRYVRLAMCTLCRSMHWTCLLNWTTWSVNYQVHHARAQSLKAASTSLVPACADASVVTPSANVSEPIVRVTLRISTTAGNLPIVVSELQASVANSTAPFVQGFRSKGHNVSTIFIDSITPSYVSLAPSCCLQVHSGFAEALYNYVSTSWHEAPS